jgi:nucleotide-binding universal stress UspA family protein
MFTCILVPLDGSELAEQVLPHVAALAQRFGARVTLLRAITPMSQVMAEEAALNEPDGEPDSFAEAEQREAREYLAAAAQRLHEQGVAAAWEYPQGDAAEVIAARAIALSVDLIAMTTHGRGGLGRLVFGSVSDAVLRRAPCPLLLVRVGAADAAKERTAQ